MGLVITILVLGLLASLSPTTIVVFILVLATNRARANAAAFLVGWSVSLVVVFALSYGLGAARQTQQGAGHTTLAAVEVLLGVALLATARREWGRRRRPRSSSGVTRRFNERLQRLNPWEAAVVGVLKEPWTLTAAAAVVVVRHHGALLVALLALLVFTIASTATVGLAYLYFARQPGAAQAHLDAIKDRMVESGPLITTIVSLVVGLYLIVGGVAGILHG